MTAEDHIITVEREPSRQRHGTATSLGLYRAVCSCGQYRSTPTSQRSAERLGQRHVESKVDQ